MQVLRKRQQGKDHEVEFTHSLPPYQADFLVLLFRRD